MKKYNKIQSLIILCLSLSILIVTVPSSFADSDPITTPPKEVHLFPENTFIPEGFDDNDNIQVIISGYLPNTCYKTGLVKSHVNLGEKTIYIENNAYISASLWCIQVITPYVHSIDLGVLPVGQYQVLVKDPKDHLKQQGILNVVKSNSNLIDDNLYAPVQDAFLEYSNSSQPISIDPYLVIRGQFSSDCMHLKEIKVLYRSSHIIEILPIASFDLNRECHSTTLPFESKVAIQAPWIGNTLVYIRSLNGQAISRVIEF